MFDWARKDDEDYEALKRNTLVDFQEILNRIRAMENTVRTDYEAHTGGTGQPPRHPLYKDLATLPVAGAGVPPDGIGTWRHLGTVSDLGSAATGTLQEATNPRSMLLHAYKGGAAEITQNHVRFSNDLEANPDALHIVFRSGLHAQEHWGGMVIGKDTPPEIKRMAIAVARYLDIPLAKTKISKKDEMGSRGYLAELRTAYGAQPPSMRMNARFNGIGAPAAA